MLKIIFAHHSVPTVGRRAGALANDFFDAPLVDCCVAFWMNKQNIVFTLKKFNNGKTGTKEANNSQ